MSKKLYNLSDEHRAQLKPWADKWIANAMSVAPMTEKDRAICRDAVRELYRLAGKTPPPDHRIVFVSSPFVARFAAGFAAAVWWLRKNPKSELNTRAATDDATRAATNDATRAVTNAATIAATIAATDAATDGATDDATRAVTRAATDDATRAATHEATTDATDGRLIKHDHSKWYVIPGINQIVEFGDSLAGNRLALRCAQEAWKIYQGGNQWSAWSSYLSFFRHVAKLDIAWEKWDCWEKLSEHSGWRFVHEEFCIISDRPEVLKVDEDNRPHCEDGPFCRWRDGTELYSLRGVRLPAHWVLTPAHAISPQSVLAEKNVDIRRELIRKIGIESMLTALPHKVLDTEGNYQLIRIDFPDGPQDTRYLKMLNPSINVYHLEGVERECNTVQEAKNWRAARFGKVNWKPEVLT